ncbi:MAG: EpsI family protein [Armatimonadetes bacterium]|nr:EpsI family protein [Armatimonadota bacterium]
MERLTKNIYIVSAIFTFVGISYFAAKKSDPGEKTEADMIALAPETVAGMPYAKSADPSLKGISYKMDELTYKLLDPFGIVARRYTKGSKIYDVVLISSRSKDSFHDPRVCFSAQGWTIENFKDVNIPTKTRGNVPAMIINMSKEKNPGHLAAFFYKGPAGDFYSNTKKFKLGMWSERLKSILSGKLFSNDMNMDGTFYRIIPEHERATEAELISFISMYLEAANTSSNGYF